MNSLNELAVWCIATILICAGVCFARALWTGITSWGDLACKFLTLALVGTFGFIFVRFLAF